ncbi:MAG: 4-hydroxy-3-methylbut-2-enyl diphosphate reductase [Candidatus Margulisiibacteriota bacterium]
MQILLASPSGFCGGVKSTIEQLKDVLAENRSSGVPVYCYNYPVHNTHVIQELESLGLKIITALSEIKEQGILAISAHGVSPDIIAKAKDLGMTILDTTCPKVSYAQHTARKLYDEGYRVLVLGDQNHVEVKGIAGACDGNIEVISGSGQVPAITAGEKIALIAQTTQNEPEFDRAAAAIKAVTNNFTAINTICSATHSRQKAALDIAGQVDIMIIIGDTKSANTKRLLQLCGDIVTSYQIQSAGDLKAEWFTGVKKAGITAGASTPKKIIDEVIEYIAGL